MSLSKRLRNLDVEVRGETFKIREWTAVERAEFMKRCRDDAMLAAAYLAHRCTVKEDGALLWNKETDARDEPPELTDALSVEICKLSGVDPAKAKGEAKDEEPKKD